MVAKGRSNLAQKVNNSRYQKIKRKVSYHFYKPVAVKKPVTAGQAILTFKNVAADI